MAKRKKSQGPLVQRALAFYSLPWVSRNRSEMHQSAARPTSAKILSAEQSGDEIELEQADAAPVQPADNGENQGNLI